MLFTVSVRTVVKTTLSCFSTSRIGWHVQEQWHLGMYRFWCHLVTFVRH